MPFKVIAVRKFVFSRRCHSKETGDVEIDPDKVPQNARRVDKSKIIASVKLHECSPFASTATFPNAPLVDMMEKEVDVEEVLVL